MRIFTLYSHVRKLNDARYSVNGTDLYKNSGYYDNRVKTSSKSVEKPIISKPARKRKPEDDRDYRFKSFQNSISRGTELDIGIEEKKLIESEAFLFKIDGKSIFNMGDAYKIKLNQHSTKYVFDDMSYIVFTKDEAEGYDRFGSCFGKVRHANRKVM